MKQVGCLLLVALVAGACAGKPATGPSRNQMVGAAAPPDGPWQWQRVPIVEEVEIPVCERKRENTPQIRFVPQYEEVEETVWKNVRVPLTQERCDPCTGEVKQIVYGYTNTRVESGTRKKRVFKGYEPEERPGFCFWRNEQVDTRTETRVTGWRWERVPIAPCPPAATTETPDLPTDE